MRGIPALIFALLLSTIVGTLILNMIIIALINSTRVFRLARAVVMNIVAMDYLEAPSPC